MSRLGCFACLVLILAAARAEAEDVPFVFQEVPQFQEPLHFFAGYAVGYGRRAVPPLDVSGVEHVYYAGVHVTSRLSMKLQTTLATLDQARSAYYRVTPRVRYVVLHTETVDVAISGGYFLEPGPVHGLIGSVGATYSSGRLLLGANALVEKAFSSARDLVDIIVAVGASYALLSWLSVGLEYLAQDLEDLWEEEEAEGGARHIFGPSLSMRFGRFATVTLGAGVSASRSGTGAIVRAGLTIGI